jgi:hypothetical protein
MRTAAMLGLVVPALLGLGSAGGGQARETFPATGWLGGAVLDALTGAPLAGAEVALGERAWERLADGTARLRPLAEVSALGPAGRTDSAGRFALEVALPAGARYFQVVVQAPGHREAGCALVAVERGRVAQVDLEAVPEELGEGVDDQLAERQSERRARLVAAHPEFRQDALSERIPGLRAPPPPVTTEASAGAFAVPETVYVSNLAGFTGYVDFDEYLAGVVTAEMGDGFPFEALKAQAVASRTYALERYRRTGVANGGQAYTSSFTAGSKSRTAALNTTGVAMLSGGNPIRAFFSARCNGDFTLNSEDGLSCIPGGCASPCQAGGLGAGVLSYARSRPCSSHVNCSQTSEACCAVVVGGRTQYLYGHGVGLCQRGAQQFAGRDGMDWQAILKAYYTGIALANLPVFEPGDVVETTTTLNVRDTACGNTVKARLNAGVRGTLLDGPRRPVCALASPNNYYSWWEVLYSDGTRGWSAEDYLRLTVSCTTTLTPVSHSLGPGASTNSLSLAANAGCSWSASTADSWIVFASATSGQGSATLSYRVTTNPGPGPRAGSLLAGGRAFAVRQASPPPRLTVALSGNQVVLSWPAAVTDYWVEATSLLGGSAWTALPGPPVVSGGLNTLRQPLASGPQFYRLGWVPGP